MKALGLTQEDLVDTLGVTSRGAVGHYFTGRRHLKTHQALSLARHLGMSMDELFGDELDVYGETKPAEGLQVKEESNASEYQPLQMYRVPVIDVSLAAGTGGHVDHEEVIGYRAVPMEGLLDANVEPCMARIVRVKGDSMDDTFIDGDTILVNSASKRLISDKIFAFELEGYLRVKRFMKMIDGTWRVVSDNPDKDLYPDETISPLNVDQLRIIGEVVALVFRKM
jgi:phage repressor protein C with HTH and peptisase S24 domain